MGQNLWAVSIGASIGTQVILPSFVGNASKKGGGEASERGRGFGETRPRRTSRKGEREDLLLLHGDRPGLDRVHAFSFVRSFTPSFLPP